MLYCRCVWSWQPGVSGTRTGTGKQCPDGVLCVRVRWRPWQVWTTTRAAERAAACQPPYRGIPLQLWNHLGQHSAHGNASLETNVAVVVFIALVAHYLLPSSSEDGWWQQHSVGYQRLGRTSILPPQNSWDAWCPPYQSRQKSAYKTKQIYLFDLIKVCSHNSAKEFFVLSERFKLSPQFLPPLMISAPRYAIGWWA